MDTAVDGVRGELFTGMLLRGVAHLLLIRGPVQGSSSSLRGLGLYHPGPMGGVTDGGEAPLVREEVNPLLGYMASVLGVPIPIDRFASRTLYSANAVP